MRRWLFSRRRYVASALVQKMRSSVSAVVIANVQSLQAVPFLERGSSARPACRRLRRELGPHRRQGDRLAAPRDATSSRTTPCATTSSRYHGIARAGSPSPAGRRPTSFTVDVRVRQYERAPHCAAGSIPSRPLVLVMGNTPTNAPYEGRFVDRLVAWWRGVGARTNVPLLFRPHPRDREWRERFAAALEHRGRRRAGAQLHGHRRARHAAPARRLRRRERGDDPARRARQRPSCRLRPLRRGCSARRAATRRSTSSGEHYEELAASDAFLPSRATSRRSSPGSSERSTQPDELADERRRVAHDVVGEVDGKRRRARGRRDRQDGAPAGVGPRERRSPRRPPAPRRMKAGATGSTKWRSAKRPSAFSSTTAKAASARATSVGQPRGRRNAIAIRPSRIHIQGRGYQRESWLRRSASCALPVSIGQRAEECARLRGGSRSKRARSLGVVELEVPLGRRRPHLPDALVGPRDPDDLTRRDRLALGRRGEASCRR